MPTRVATNSRSRLIWGTIVSRSAAPQSGFARNPATMYANSTTVNHLRYATTVAYDAQMVMATMAAPTTGTKIMAGSPVSMVTTSAIPARSAAMLNTLATSKRRQAT